MTLPAPYYADDAVTLYHGDCLDLLPLLPRASVDAVVTDPPYGLVSNKRGGSGVASVNLSTPHGRARIGTGNGPGGFMGKAWDSSVPGVEYWREALRVAKPGAHLVAFGGTRTFHRLACAVEDAGWEIRDCLSWLYGSGFPKSLDVSKAIDKVNGETGRLRKFTAWMRTTGLTARQIDEATETKMGGHYLTSKSQPAIPTRRLWAKLRPMCGAVPPWVDELVERIEAEREVVGHASVPIGHGFAGAVYQGSGNTGNKVVPLTTPATDAAKQWQGWGTALKPAWEPIIVARKPLDGTVAANVLAHGTGALNVDGCRVEMGDDYDPDAVQRQRAAGGGTVGNAFGTGSLVGKEIPTFNPKGRWPANVVLDDEAAAMLDAQTGGDSGGASRFFYVAKASRSERERGCENLTRRQQDETRDPDAPGANNPRNRGGGGRGNHHPTIKPIALMQWLVRLVSPPGGLVLDPFAGSGTTGLAARAEGVRSMLIEREAEYVEVAARRLERMPRGTDVQPSLFGEVGS